MIAYLSRIKEKHMQGAYIGISEKKIGLIAKAV